MKDGLTKAGKKPTPASPHNYIRDYVRARRERTRTKRTHNLLSKIRLLPSKKPIPPGLLKQETSLTGLRTLGVIFLICLTLFCLLVFFHETS